MSSYQYSQQLSQTPTSFSLQREQQQVGLGNNETNMRLTRYSAELKKKHRMEAALLAYKPKPFHWRTTKGHLNVNPYTKNPATTQFLGSSMTPLDPSKFAPINRVFKPSVYTDTSNKYQPDMNTYVDLLKDGLIPGGNTAPPQFMYNNQRDMREGDMQRQEQFANPSNPRQVPLDVAEEEAGLIDHNKADPERNA